MRTHRLRKRSNVVYDFEHEGHLVCRTAIYPSEKIAKIAVGHLKKYWNKVQQRGCVVLASNIDKEAFV